MRKSCFSQNDWQVFFQQELIPNKSRYRPRRRVTLETRHGILLVKSCSKLVKWFQSEALNSCVTWRKIAKRKWKWHLEMLIFILTGRAPKVHFPLLLRKPLKKVAEETKCVRSSWNETFKLLLCVIEKNTNWLAMFSLFIWLFKCNNYNT